MWPHHTSSLVSISVFLCFDKAIHFSICSRYVHYVTTHLLLFVCFVYCTKETCMVQYRCSTQQFHVVCIHKTANTCCLSEYPLHSAHLNKGGNKMKKMLRITALLLVIVTMCGAVATPVSASRYIKNYTTVTGRLTNSQWQTTPLHVYTDGKTAKLRICTFNQAGERTNGKLKVLIFSDNGGRWEETITGCTWNGTTNIKLLAGNTHYTVYIFRANTTNTNLTKTYYVSIDFQSSWHAWH